MIGPFMYLAAHMVIFLKKSGNCTRQQTKKIILLQYKKNFLSKKILYLDSETLKWRIFDLVLVFHKLSKQLCNLSALTAAEYQANTNTNFFKFENF